MPKIVNVNIFYIWIKHPQSIHLYASHRVVLYVRNNIPRFSFLPVWFITFLYISQTIPMVHKVPNKNNYKLDLQCSIHKLSRCTGSVIYSIWTPASIRTTSNKEKELIFNDVHLVNINFTECIHIHLLGPEFLTASTYPLRWLITP